MSARPAPAPPTRAARRSYDNTLRRQQAAATRRRIVAAGSELLHQSEVRDWAGLTVRAVAERAGVNERTVYRHFENERGLRHAVMRQLEQEAGIDLDHVRLEDVGRLAARILRHVACFPSAPRPALDPTLSETRRRVHEALYRAVADETPAWSDTERTTAAAVLDLLWSVGAYERMVADWELDPATAIEALSWAISLVEQAVGQGRRPRNAAS